MNEDVSLNDDLSAIPMDAAVYRQMIQQLFEKSIQRYGAGSEQAQMLKLHLAEHSPGD